MKEVDCKVVGTNKQTSCHFFSVTDTYKNKSKNQIHDYMTITHEILLRDITFSAHTYILYFIDITFLKTEVPI